MDIGALEDYLAPSIINAEVINNGQTFAARIEHIIDPIAIWCEGIGKVNLTIIAKHKYTHGVGSCTFKVCRGNNRIKGSTLWRSLGCRTVDTVKTLTWCPFPVRDKVG